MAFLEIERAGPLAGAVPVQGSKNAALPILAASLLNHDKTVLRNVPKIRDVENMIRLMRRMGCVVEWRENAVVIDASALGCCELMPDVTKSMRSSVNLLAPLLYRCGRAVLYEPGGCSLGRRPIDLHLYALEKMGAVFSRQQDRIEAKAPGLHGAAIRFRFPSVGATQQALTAAVVARGETRISNCAREPEVVELCRFLCAMGAKIRGIGTEELWVTGSVMCAPVCYTIGADRIVAATYMSAVAACGGEARLSGVNRQHMTGIIKPFIEMGCEVETDSQGMIIARHRRLKPIPYIETNPYPGFPTDVQSLLLAVLTQADGQSVVKEKVFDARFRAAYQLQKMGADIIINNNCAVVAGGRLTGCEVEAPDLRGGAALVIAGLAAEGTTYVTGYSHIRRGYEDIAGDLFRLGAGGIRLIETEGILEKERVAEAEGISETERILKTTELRPVAAVH